MTIARNAEVVTSNWLVVQWNDNKMGNIETKLGTFQLMVLIRSLVQVELRRLLS